MDYWIVGPPTFGSQPSIHPSIQPPVRKWSERQDSHLRPRGPKPRALKTELRSVKLARRAVARRAKAGQRGRTCTCGPSVPSRACCCYTTRCCAPANQGNVAGAVKHETKNPGNSLAVRLFEMETAILLAPK